MSEFWLAVNAVARMIRYSVGTWPRTIRAAILILVIGIALGGIW
jgi:hypothetical protein